MAEIIFEGTIVVKFIYSEKATTFSEIFTLLLSYVVPVKSKVKISQNFEAFSDYTYELYIYRTKVHIFQESYKILELSLSLNSIYSEKAT